MRKVNKNKQFSIYIHLRGRKSFQKELYCLLGNSEMSDKIETYYGDRL